MVGEWLRQRRESLDLSQKDITAQLQTRGCEVSQSMVSHWENGRYNLPLSDVPFMKAIAKVYRVSLIDLLMAVGYDLSDTDVPMTLSWKERQAIEAWRRGDREGAIKIIIGV
jgi:transcriptional regulator with XRE-family HTH domain